MSSVSPTPLPVSAHAGRAKRKHDSSSPEVEAEQQADAAAAATAASMSHTHATRSHSSVALSAAADAAAVAAASPFPLAVALTTTEFDCSAFPPPSLRALCLAIFRDAALVDDEHAAAASAASPPPPSDGSPFRISSLSLSRLLLRVEAAHHSENSYHAFPHAVHVMFQLWRIMRARMMQHYTEMERLTLLLAALCHDLAHCGLSNALCLSEGYALNADHAAKGYTRNILERNSVERAAELLQGKPIAVPTGTTEHAHSSAGGEPEPEAAAPINFLHEWGLSPSAQSTLLHDMSEFILGTDIGDLERHLKLKGAFAAVIGQQPQRSLHAQSRSNSHLSPPPPASSIEPIAHPNGVCSTPASDVPLSSSTAVHPASPSRSHSKSGAHHAATATAMDLCSTPASDVPLSSSTAVHAAVADAASLAPVKSPSGHHHRAAEAQAPLRVCSTPGSDVPLSSSTAVHPHTASTAHAPVRSSSGHHAAEAPVRVCSTPGSDVPLSSSTAVHPHTATGHALHHAAAVFVRSKSPSRSPSPSHADSAAHTMADVCSTPASDTPLTSSTAVHPASHEAAAPAVCSTPSSDVVGSSSTAVHRSPSLTSPPPAAAAHRSPSPSAAHRQAPSSFSWSNAAHRRSLSQLVLLVADVGCVSELFPICLAWSDRLYEENNLGQSFVRQMAAATAAARHRRGHGKSCTAHEGHHHAKKAREESEVKQREEQRAEEEEAAVGEPAAAQFVSRYITETADLPPAATADAAAAAAASAASSSAAAAAAVSPRSPLSDPLSSFYAAQQGFLHGYAVPLFLLLHDSNLLPRPFSSQLYPQLQSNLRALSLTAVTKQRGAHKMQLHLRTGLRIDEATRKDIERLKNEYQACAEFHRLICRQEKEDSAAAAAAPTPAAAVPWPQRSTPIQSLQFDAD